MLSYLLVYASLCQLPGKHGDYDVGYGILYS